MLSRTLLCLAIAAASTPSLADTVWMKNGDRLSGKIKVFDGGKLMLETEYGGSIPLDWAKVATLESDHSWMESYSTFVRSTSVIMLRSISCK